MPASLLEMENPVEESAANAGRLQAHVEHIRSDISDMRIDIRRLNDKVDGVDKTLSAKIDGVLQSISELKIGRALDRVWWLLMSGALLGIMARAFKWI